MISQSAENVSILLRSYSKSKREPRTYKTCGIEQTLRGGVLDLLELSGPLGVTRTSWPGQSHEVEPRRDWRCYRPPASSAPSRTPSPNVTVVLESCRPQGSGARVLGPPQQDKQVLLPSLHSSRISPPFQPRLQAFLLCGLHTS
jgi:hypothetical protein